MVCLLGLKYFVIINLFSLINWAETNSDIMCCDSQHLTECVMIKNGWGKKGKMIHIHAELRLQPRITDSSNTHMLVDEHKSDVCAKICAVTTMQTHTATTVTYRVSSCAYWFHWNWLSFSQRSAGADLLLLKRTYHVQNTKLTSLCIIMSTETKQQKQLYTGPC